jgi:hypothetical protein
VGRLGLSWFLGLGWSWAGAGTWLPVLPIGQAADLMTACLPAQQQPVSPSHIMPCYPSAFAANLQITNAAPAKLAMGLSRA